MVAALAGFHLAATATTQPAAAEAKADDRHDDDEEQPNGHAHDVAHAIRGVLWTERRTLASYVFTINCYHFDTHRDI